MNFTDARLAAEGLAGYEHWRARKGMPLENRWREKLEAQGLTLEPVVELPRGDAYEEPITPETR